MAGVCLAATLGQVEVSVLLLRRLLANLFSLLEGTGDLAIEYKTLFPQCGRGTISHCSAVVSVILSKVPKIELRAVLEK